MKGEEVEGKEMEPREGSAAQMYCPNCGVKVRGYKDNDGVMRQTCPRCGVVIFSKLRKKREMDIKVITQ